MLAVRAEEFETEPWLPHRILIKQLNEVNAYWYCSSSQFSKGRGVVEEHLDPVELIQGTTGAKQGHVIHFFSDSFSTELLPRFHYITSRQDHTTTSACNCRARTAAVIRDRHFDRFSRIPLSFPRYELGCIVTSTNSKSRGYNVTCRNQLAGSLPFHEISEQFCGAQRPYMSSTWTNYHCCYTRKSTLPGFYDPECLASEAFSRHIWHLA